MISLLKTNNGRVTMKLNLNHDEINKRISKAIAKYRQASVAHLGRVWYTRTRFSVFSNLFQAT